MTAGVAQMVEALLSTVGGQGVLLRMPAPAVPGDPGEQVGLATPLFQDAPLGPVVLRKLRAKTGVGTAHVAAAEYELLVPAAAVEALVGSLAFDAASVLFAQAAGVVLDGDLLTITSATGVQAFGGVVVWRLGLQGRAALAI